MTRWGGQQTAEPGDRRCEGPEKFGGPPGRVPAGRVTAGQPPDSRGARNHLITFGARSTTRSAVCVPNWPRSLPLQAFPANRAVAHASCMPQSTDAAARASRACDHQSTRTTTHQSALTQSAALLGNAGHQQPHSSKFSATHKLPVRLVQRLHKLQNPAAFNANTSCCVRLV